VRKIVAGLFMSLDGVVEAPEAWTGPYFNEESQQEIGSIIAEGDTLLLGRKTYEMFAASFSGQSGGMADTMNRFPKVVVSKTLERADWEHSTLLNGDVVEEIRALKQRPGKNINMSGSATLIRSLLRAGLLDELRLQVFPLVVGRGRRLFEDDDELDLALADSATFSTGVVNLVYRPAA
jgi:dihydrofolate reductase